MDSVSGRGLLATSAAAIVLPALAQAFGALLKGDIEKWAGMIQIAGIKAP